MKVIMSFFVLVMLGISGCSTVTKPTTNKIETQAQISPTLSQLAAKGLKRKVAIARFSNETKHGNSFLLNNKNDRIGKQAMDILSARLTETGKFIMFERADLDKVNDENALSNITTDVIGADYLIVGSVSEFGRTASSEVGIFSRNKKQIAQAKVNVRLIDVKTGQIIFSEEGSGKAESEANTVFGVGEKAGYNSSLDDKALSSAISKLISNLMENLLDKPWRSYVLAEQDGLFIIAGGDSQGINIGDEFSVLKQGRKIKNPQTGIMIELPGKEVGQLQVIQTSGSGQNEISLCELARGDISGLDFSTLYIQEKKGN